MNENSSQDVNVQVGTSDQIAVARHLGLEEVSAQTTTELISQIETKLGQDTMLEQARWFLMSVLRHANKAKWQELAESGVSEEDQYKLAEQYIGADDLKQSLRTVLKDAHCRFTLIRFAKARNISKLTLSTTTKAYKEACALLKQLDLVTAPPRPVRNRAAHKKATASGTAANRRATRRGFFEEGENETLGQVEIHTPTLKSKDDSQLSEEEYAELEQIIEGDGERVPASNWSYPTNEDRFSLLLGLAAGGGAFVIVLLLFL